VWSLFITTFEGLKNLFPTRNYYLILLDEFNTFRFLSAFVTKIPADNFDKLEEISSAVSSLPFEQPIVVPQWSTQEFIQTNENVQKNPLASFKLRVSPGGYATETFISQVSSPSTILVRRSGSLIEHAILLCSLFLGKDVQAFVAIGESNNRPYAWVITIIPNDKLDIVSTNTSSNPNQTINTSMFFQNVKYNDDNDHQFVNNEFLKYEQVERNLIFYNNYTVLHWDPISGTKN
jgi:hypothetical protein